MQRDDDKIPRGSRRCNQRKELGCRNCAHFGIFGSGGGLNKAKANTAVIPSEVEESRWITQGVSTGSFDFAALRSG